MGSKGTALITGASSGIGAAFARKLAARKHNLILVARRKEKLDALATTLQQRYPITVEVLLADLSHTGEIEKVTKRIAAVEDLKFLINNAGLGLPGLFDTIAADKQMGMMNVHITATIDLTRAALPTMKRRRDGAIINVSSISAFLPMPGSVTYSASKAYIVNFSRGLQAELVGEGVQVQALCPGFTDTGFHLTSEYKDFDRSTVPKFMWMSSEAVVAESLRALRRNQTVCIPGLRNRLMVAVASHPLMAPFVESAMRKQRK